MIIVSYYTGGTPYAQESLRLRESLFAWGLKHAITRIAARGSWEANARYKGEFCAAMLAEHADQAPVVFLDADAEVLQPLDFLNDVQDADLALTYNSGIGRRRYFLRQWRSGTIAMWPTAATYRVLNLWAMYCRDRLNVPERHRPCWDTGNQDLLNVVLENARDVRLHRLPDQWCWAVDRPLPEHTTVVVEQHMANRRLRGTVNG